MLNDLALRLPASEGVFQQEPPIGAAPPDAGSTWRSALGGILLWRCARGLFKGRKSSTPAAHGATWKQLGVKNAFVVSGAVECWKTE